MLKRRLSLQRRSVLVDTIGEDTYKDHQQVKSFVELCDILIKNPASFRIAYHPEDTSLSLEEDFERVCQAVLACRNVTFAVEEISVYCNSSKMPTPLQHIVARGRHRDISFFCTSQRASMVHPLIRSQSHEIITFRQIEPRDIEWLKAVMGEQAEQVPNLRGHAFIDWKIDSFTQSDKPLPGSSTGEYSGSDLPSSESVHAPGERDGALEAETEPSPPQ